MAKAIAAAKEVEAAECKTNKTADPDETLYCHQKKAVSPSTAPTTDSMPTVDAPAKKSEAFLEAINLGAQV